MPSFLVDDVRRLLIVNGYQRHWRKDRNDFVPVVGLLSLGLYS